MVCPASRPITAGVGPSTPTTLRGQEVGIMDESLKVQKCSWTTNQQLNLTPWIKCFCEPLQQLQITELAILFCVVIHHAACYVAEQEM